MPNYECPKCKQPCETHEDDQRFDAHAPQGIATYGSVYLLSECCDAVLATDDGDDDYFDYDPDDYLNF